MGVEEVRDAGAPPVEGWPRADLGLALQMTPRSPGKPSRGSALLLPLAHGGPNGDLPTEQIHRIQLWPTEKQKTERWGKAASQDPACLFLFKNKSSSKSDHVHVSLPILKITCNSQAGGLVAIYFFTCRSWTQTREKSDFSRTMKPSWWRWSQTKETQGKKRKIFPCIVIRCHL